jgi:hypothetical protein
VGKYRPIGFPRIFHPWEMNELHPGPRPGDDFFPRSEG